MRHFSLPLCLLFLAMSAAGACAKSNNVDDSAGAGGTPETASSTSVTTTTGPSTSISSSAQSGTGGSGGNGGSGGMGGAGGGGGMGPICGDMMIDIGEECDGQNLDNATCETLGFTGGMLACDPYCRFDKTGCTACHDGMIQPQYGEDCDFDAKNQPLILATCQSLGFNSPNNPGCTQTCKYDTTPCLCGNGMIDGAEQCDSPDLGGATCVSKGFAGGMLACTPTCQFDTSGCSLCGNGKIDGGEACDSPDLGGATCASKGFTAGTLACTPQCTFDTSGCTKCGNGILEAGEQCDDGNQMSGDGCSATCQNEVVACDPDGVYAVIMGGPISYSCCSGLVNVNVSSFIFSNNGATIQSSPSNPATMNGAATTCPSGNFANQGSIPGGCTEGYSVSGSYIDKDTWVGTYQLTFVGAQCDCFNGQLGAPCVNQIFPITAQR